MNTKPAGTPRQKGLGACETDQHLADQLATGYLMIGDYNWDGRRSTKAAAKAYAAALHAALTLDEKRQEEVCSRIAKQLASLGGENPRSQIEELGKLATAWIAKEQGITEQDSVAPLLSWPFRVAGRIVVGGDSSGEFSPTTLTRIIAEERNGT